MKFRYNEKVQIINGFYKGQSGIVKSYTNWFFVFKVYTVSVETSIFHFYLSVRERYLRSLDFPNKDFNQKLENLIK